MVNRKIVWIVSIIVLLIIALFVIAFFQPFFLRKNYIGKNIKIDIPKSAKIVEYNLGINSYGISPFYAKVELDRDSYNVWRDDNEFYQINEIKDMIKSVKREYKHKSLNLEDVEEVLFKEKFTSKNSFFIVGSTRWVVSFITKESSGKYYLYVLFD